MMIVRWRLLSRKGSKMTRHGEMSLTTRTKWRGLGRAMRCELTASADSDADADAAFGMFEAGRFDGLVCPSSWPAVVIVFSYLLCV